MARNTELCVEVSGKLWRMWVTEEVALRASKDQEFLSELVKSSTPQMEETEREHRDVEKSAEAAEKPFQWQDKAVFLLIELYREKEAEFATGMTRNSVLWNEISKEINAKHKNYEVTGLQCSSKWSGLKRSYETIYDENKKSGNCQNSWTFFSVMDTMMGHKVSMQPLAEASSDGPAPAASTSTASSASASMLAAPTKKNPVKKRKLEALLENYMEELQKEKQDIKRRHLEDRALKAERHQKRSAEQAQRHAERIEMQQALVNLLKSLTPV